MKVLLNGYEINNPDNRVYLDEPLDGLDIPSIRTSEGVRAGASGGYIGAQLYGPRRITLRGRVFANDVNEAKLKRRALQAAVAVLYPSQITMNIVDDDSKSYVLYVNLTDFLMPIQRWQGKSEFKIELLAPDHVIYDDSSAGLTTVSLSRQTGGGLSWPLSWPLTWSAGSSPTSAVNSGTVIVYPVITLTGIMSNPIITNRTTGKVFKLNPLVTTAGDVVTIDMNPSKRSMLLNGGNIGDRITTDSSWLNLQPGTNTLALTTSSGSDTVTGTVSWKPGVLGI